MCVDIEEYVICTWGILFHATILYILTKLTHYSCFQTTQYKLAIIATIIGSAAAFTTSTVSRVPCISSTSSLAAAKSPEEDLGECTQNNSGSDYAYTYVLCL